MGLIHSAVAKQHETKAPTIGLHTYYQGQHASYFRNSWNASQAKWKETIPYGGSCNQTNHCGQIQIYGNSYALYTTWQPSCPAKTNILPNISSICYDLPVYQHPPPTPPYRLNIRQVSLGEWGGLYQAAIFILKPLLQQQPTIWWNRILSNKPFTAVKCAILRMGYFKNINGVQCAFGTMVVWFNYRNGGTTRRSGTCWSDWTIAKVVIGICKVISCRQCSDPSHTSIPTSIPTSLIACPRSHLPYPRSPLPPPIPTSVPTHLHWLRPWFCQWVPYIPTYNMPGVAPDSGVLGWDTDFKLIWMLILGWFGH